MSEITHSVGSEGVNHEADVRTVQQLLNAQAQRFGLVPLPVDGQVSDELINAIRLFQRKVLGAKTGDGRVDVGGRTWQALTMPAGTATGAALSGAQWWHANQARFPNSNRVADLEPGFAAKVTAFLKALQAAGASVDVSATRRNHTRAYLMHYSWKVAKGVVKPGEVPPEPGCDIVWDHGNDAKSRKAAQEMVDLFELVFQPSLTSRHIQGLAIDMSIRWPGTITVKTAAGAAVALSSPRDGSNTALHKVGAGYGVIKLLSDPPHWSSDGH
ncbi:peptidoglycan-binding domain-containing protein [Azohydromonas caseinilytica]|uniref:peptidoglycan-binding domain-containing protein n=1 Tax=Azohydromonas caseinilytica TaxID=2728836 RepID=UPI00197C2382|nr:peptidoglycan-binding domain-containing protein [Azohydromonas caseinilytica]